MGAEDIREADEPIWAQ